MRVQTGSFRNYPANCLPVLRWSGKKDLLNLLARLLVVVYQQRAVNFAKHPIHFQRLGVNLLCPIEFKYAVGKNKYRHSVPIPAYKGGKLRVINSVGKHPENIESCKIDSDRFKTCLDKQLFI